MASVPAIPALAQTVRTSSVAPIAFMNRCAHRAALERALGAHVAVGEDRLAAVSLDRRAEAVGGGLERLLPAGLAELARALRPGADQGPQQALVGVHAVEVVGDLAAQKAGRDRVLGVAGDRHRAPLRVHRGQHRAGVGAVVGAGPADDALAHAAIIAPCTD